MPYKQTSTQYTVHSASCASWPCMALHGLAWPCMALHGLSAAQLAQCQALRAEAGRLWTDLVTLLMQARAEGRWLSAGALEQATKGGQYALHSQRVQALCQRFAANVETATELRRQECAETGHLQTQYPHHPKV
jgi:putative transposase